MVYRLASELSDRIAAIASVAGPMGTEACRPLRPVPVLHIHGTKDLAVPFEGGKGTLDPSGTDYSSVNYTIQAWAKADECASTPRVEELLDRAEDGTTVSRQTYSGGRNGAEVVLITVKGGGHTWPGREFGPELKILGLSSKEISANELIWEFFEKHRMR